MLPRQQGCDTRSSRIRQPLSADRQVARQAQDTCLPLLSEVCKRLQAQGNDATIPWIPAREWVGGNEVADMWAKATVESPGGGVITTGSKPCTPNETNHRGGTRGTKVGIADNVNRRQSLPGYKPPKSLSSARASRVSERRWPAGTRIPASLGTCSNGTFLYNRLRKIPSDHCGSGKEQTRRHLFVECKPQGKEPWKSAGNACGRTRPRAPTVRTIFNDEKAILEVLTSCGKPR